MKVFCKKSYHKYYHKNNQYDTRTKLNGKYYYILNE